LSKDVTTLNVPKPESSKRIVLTTIVNCHGEKSEIIKMPYDWKGNKLLNDLKRKFNEFGL